MNNETFKIQAMLFAANGSGAAASVGGKVGVNSPAGHSAGADWTERLTGSDNIGNPVLKTGIEDSVQDFKNTLRNRITAQTPVKTQTEAETVNKQALQSMGLYSPSLAFLADIVAAGGKAEVAAKASLNDKSGLGAGQSGDKLQAAASQVVNVNSTVSGVHVVLPTSQDAAKNIKIFLSGLRDQLVEAGSGPKQGKSSADTASGPDSATLAGSDKVTVKPAAVNQAAAVPDSQAGEHPDAITASEMSGKADAGQKTKVAGNLDPASQNTDQNESASKNTPQDGEPAATGSTKAAEVLVPKGGVLSDAQAERSMNKSFDLSQKSPTETAESASETGKEMSNQGKAFADDHAQMSSQMLAGNGKSQQQPGANKLNIEQQHAQEAEVSGAAAKKSGTDILSKGFDGAGSQQNYSYGDLHIAGGSQQTASFTQAVKNSNQLVNSETSPGVGEQIWTSVSNSLRTGTGGQEINIRLNPPELGTVSIKFQQQDGQIVGSVKVSNETTRYEIEQALPQIVRNLSEQGVQIKRMEVSLSDRGLPEDAKDQLMQNGTYHQRQNFHEGAASNSREDLWASNEWLMGENNYHHDAESGYMSVNKDSLSILV